MSILENVESVENLKEIIQTGITLELGACLIYLNFVYSIKPKTNNQIKKIIKRVAIEEMGHMVVFGNILSSIGGKPSFVKASPTFPTKLPFNILPWIDFDLESLTTKNLKKSGMQIERGSEMQEHQIGMEHELEKFSLESLSNHLKKTYKKTDRMGTTMCEFFESLKNTITKLDKKFGNKLFCGDPKKQICMNLPKIRAMNKIVDLKSCLEVLDRLVEESEGGGDHVIDSHYFSFSQVLNGKKLVKKNDGFYYWENDESFRMDTNNIFKMRKILKINELSKDEKPVWDEFHKIYFDMLKYFDKLYNCKGKPDVGEIQRIMKKMDECGKELAKFGICPNYDISRFL